jgi:hypothetical protein
MGKELVPRNPVQLQEKKAQQFRFALLLAETDLEPNELAKKLGKGNPKVAARWRKRYQRWKRDPDFAELIAAQVNGNLVLGLPRATNALIRRAAKGNVPAIKLLMESSGFWSPRHVEEHTGEVAITLRGLSRPPAVVDEDTVIEGDVVED